MAPLFCFMAYNQENNRVFILLLLLNIFRRNLYNIKPKSIPDQFTFNGVRLGPYSFSILHNPLSIFNI